MPTVSQGASQTITLGENDAYKVTIADGGEAYVDLVSGAPGAPYQSPRLRSPTTSMQFGPYGAPATIRVRSVVGTTTYDQVALGLVDVKLNPVTGAIVGANGQPISVGGGIKPSTWFATQEFANPVAYAATGSTFAMRRSRRLPFSGGRAIGYNAGAVPAVGLNYAVGVVTSAAWAQQAQGIVPVYWGGGKADPVAAGLYRGTPGIDITELALSDTFDLQSIARTDGGTGSITELRAFAPNGANTVYALAPDQGSAVQLMTAGGVSYSGASKAGDFVTTNQTGFTSVGTSAHFIFGDLLLFTPDYPVYTVAAGGDSIAQGQYGDEGRQNEVRIACDALSLAGVGNFEYLGHTRPGKGAGVFGPSDIAFLKTMRPNIFVYTPSSPNDSGLDVPATLTKTRNQLAAVYQACQEVGARLIVATSTPWAPFNTSQDNALKSFNTWLQAWALQAGVPFHDRYSVTTDGASPAALQIAYQWPSGNANQKAHPNATCYQALAAPMQALIRTLIGK